MSMRSNHGNEGLLHDSTHHHDGPYWQRAHHDWRFWTGLTLMLVTITIYALGNDWMALLYHHQRQMNHQSVVPGEGRTLPPKLA